MAKCETVWIDYTNYRGERARRLILPLKMEYTSNEWHPEHQWIMTAEDITDKANPKRRGFAMCDIHSWVRAHPHPIR